MRRSVRAVAMVLLGLWPSLQGQAADTMGELRCSIAGGIGIAVIGKRETSCVYYRRDGAVEFYLGSLGRLGLDLGPAQARPAIFAVTAPAPAAPGALEGDFVGLGVGATVGRGVAGDGLVGGRGGMVTLVPIANSRLTGLNFNAGLGSLSLRYVGTEGRRARYRGTIPDGLD